MTDQTFEYRSTIPAPAEMLFRWHTREGAFERLNPPWESVELASHEGVHDGQRAEIVMKLGPLRKTWLAEHRNFRDGESFQDIQLSGPFARWEHTHSVTPHGADTSQLTDHVDYRLPAAPLSEWLFGGMTRRKLNRLFAYRHRVTHDDLRQQSLYQDRPTMKVLITGGTGLVGSELRPLLTTGGHQAFTLTRSTPQTDTQIQWDPSAAEFEPRLFEGFDAVVHLAGENIAGKRWSPKVKQRLRDSRVEVTTKLVTALKSLETPPKTLISASAIGWYGDRGDEELAEGAAAGDGFLPDLCQEWEAASHPAWDAGIRVVNPRIGIVLSPKGGALAKMLTPFKLGAGGVLGSGRQYMSWIGIDDVVGALYHALQNDDVVGPVNLVAPHPVTNREFTKTLGRVLRRPTIFPVPGFMARLAFGEMADALLLSSTRVVPGVLQDTGYEFRHSDLEDCLRHLLGR